MFSRKVMAYGKEQLRKVGDKLRQFDDAYASKIVDMYMGSKDNPREYADNPLLGTIAGIGAIYGGGTPLSQRSGKQEMMAPLSSYTSAAARYAAPAAGVTMAGVALMDLTSAFGGPADRPEPNTLSM